MTADAAQRQQALDPARSFLVQAPAGSGKTELLTQRFLRLLAVVEEPEEVVALTFTRKAAGEMRSRIVRALAAAGDPAPAAPHERQTHELARAAADRSAERGWALAEQPSRLRIQTLDALCASITRQMPVSSAFGAQPAIAREPARLYLEAARRTLDELEAGHYWSRAIERLLVHLGNDLDRVESLLADMLARRDQWLRFVADRDDPRTQRENLEAALAREVGGALERAAAAFPDDAVAPLAELARFAARNLRQAGSDSPIANLHTLRNLPEPVVGSLGRWCGIAELLLTQQGRWRKKVDKKQGFPAKGDAPDAGEAARYAAMKEAHADLVGTLAAVPGLRHALEAVPCLPPVVYRDDQWEVAAALFELLKLAAAHLQVVFGERGEVDFTEMAARAERALGAPEAPSDLALALDYRIRHLLVDEFQDTSLTQFRLLERLVAGWQPGDGRSLFLVGDPMQSIYRFRQAEVGLFLHAAEHGLGAVSLDCLRLTANFRSRASLIEWVNRTFADVMPAVENAATGAVAFSPAEAQRPAADGPAVSLHGFDGLDPEAEAERVVQLIRRARCEDAAARVAVLVRSRRHAARLMPRLRGAGLRFQAVELEALGSRPVVRDLLALTRCLLHPADRLSWLTVLRAPWCGLTLADLAAVAGDDEAVVWTRLHDPEVLEALSADGRERVKRLRGVLAAGLDERSRRPLRRWVEGAWLALGGPAAVADEVALADADAFFDLLETVEEGGDLADFRMLSENVDALFAPPDTRADERLQVMTLHKAKGLEFEVVIVPGLGRRPGNDRQPLLFWLELPRDIPGFPGEGADLLLAPIAAAGETGERIYAWLKRLDREKTRLEDGRLLYVAATRAREQLHLLGHLPAGREKPESGSALACLWPAVGEAFAAAVAPVPEVAEASASAPLSMPMRRLSAGWHPPAPPRGVVAPAAPRPPAAEPVAFDWAGREARHVGTVVHRVLMRIARDGLDAWTERRLRQRQAAITAVLGSLGIAPRRAEELAGRVTAAVASALADERGRWLLSAHEDSRSEYALTGWMDGRPVNVVIDRTFVDADGVRWIVDYKTGRHEGGDADAFLDRERERYREQLEAYAALFALREERPIRLGLYFPMLRGWREWERPV